MSIKNDIKCTHDYRSAPVSVVIMSYAVSQFRLYHHATICNKL